MAIAIDLITKADATTVDGLSFYRYAKDASMVCQLDTSLEDGDYVEVKITDAGSGSHIMVGLGINQKGITNNTSGTRWVYGATGNLFPGNSSYMPSFTTGDVIGISLAASSIRFYKNGTAQTTIAAPTGLFPSVATGTSSLTVVHSGTFRVFEDDLEFLPSGFSAMVKKGRTTKPLITPIILSTMPATLSSGFSSGVLG